MTGQEAVQAALRAGFGDARLCRDEEGSPRLLTAYPYRFAEQHGDARISSYYFASQRSYLLLRSLAETLTAAGLPCVRDDHVALKPLALRYGLGVQGRNSLVLHPVFGSRMVLGCLKFQTELEVPEPQETKTCEDCGRCRAACPAGALESFAQVDLDRCLRMHMLSGKPYPLELRPLLGKRLVGCDSCQLCCPHNEGGTKPGGEAEPSLYQLLSGDKAAFQRLKDDIGPNTARKTRLLAQALLVAADRSDPGLIPLIEPYLHSTDPVVKEHADWAIRRLREKTARFKKEETP